MLIEQNQSTAMGLRAEGVPARQIAKIDDLQAPYALAGRRALRGLPYRCWGEGMVEWYSSGPEVYVGSGWTWTRRDRYGRGQWV